MHSIVFTSTRQVRLMRTKLWIYDYRKERTSVRLNSAEIRSHHSFPRQSIRFGYHQALYFNSNWVLLFCMFYSTQLRCKNLRYSLLTSIEFQLDNKSKVEEYEINRIKGIMLLLLYYFQWFRQNILLSLSYWIGPNHWNSSFHTSNISTSSETVMGVDVSSLIVGNVNNASTKQCSFV